MTDHEENKIPEGQEPLYKEYQTTIYYLNIKREKIKFGKIIWKLPFVAEDWEIMKEAELMEAHLSQELIRFDTKLFEGIYPQNAEHIDDDDDDNLRPFT